MKVEASATSQFSGVLRLWVNSRTSRRRGEAGEMVIDVAKFLRDRRQATEGVTHLHLVGHPHAAMELH